MTCKLWTAFAASSLLAACSADSARAPITFSYAGAGGPEHWADLSPDYGACADSSAESPIDLPSALQSEDLPDLVADYGESRLASVNTGHTVQWNYDPGSMLRLGDASYQLLQFHFHAPSEHTVDGRAYALEMHLVHRDASGKRAVIGVFVEPGAEAPLLAELRWDALPKHEGDKRADGDARFNIGELLPSGDSYRYQGSLTTPPCTEGVAWSIFAQPISFSAEQIAAFTDIYAHNARPVEPLGDRRLQLGQ